MKSDERIFQLEEDERVPGRWWVYGLNLLRVAEVQAVDRWLPFRVWIKAFLGDETPPVLLGACGIEDLDRPEIPGVEAREIDFDVTGSVIYRFEATEGREPGLLYPRLDAQVIAQKLVEYMLYDALIILVGVRDVSPVSELLDEAPAGEDYEGEFLRRLPTIARHVVWSSGDAQVLRVEGLGNEVKDEIVGACQAAEEAVRSLPWFRASESGLVWSERRLCWVPSPSGQGVDNH